MFGRMIFFNYNFLFNLFLISIRFMPSWGPFLPLEDSSDPEFAMEHSGEGFITSQLMLGITTTESYNDFSASDIQVRNFFLFSFSFFFV